MRIWNPSTGQYKVYDGVDAQGVPGQRIAGFIGTFPTTMTNNTQNGLTDVPGSAISFTKGIRPIRISVTIGIWYISGTTRTPSIELWDVDTGAIVHAAAYKPMLPIYANAAMPWDWNFEPPVQPSAGDHQWKLRVHNANVASPLTVTLAAGDPFQFCIYNA